MQVTWPPGTGEESAPLQWGGSPGENEGPFLEDGEVGVLGRVTPAGHIVFSVDERVDVNLTCRELETGKGKACEDQLRPWVGCAWGGGYLVASISFPS